MSASSAARWLHCTAAPRFEEQFPENTSEYAEEGRLAHAICELKVIKHFTTQIKPRTYTSRLKKLKENPLYQDEMDKTSDLYLEHLTERAIFATRTVLMSVDQTKTKTEWYAAITPKAMTLPTQHPPKYANLKSGSTITQEKCLTIIRLLNYTRPASTAL